MSFNSPEFFVFLSLVVVAYHVSPASLKRPILLVASYGFYMSWNPWYGVLLFAVTLISYLVGRAMDEGRGRAGVVLWTGIAGHLAILVVFKYAAFLLDNAEGLSRAFGASWRAPFLEIVPPLGLSFYVFQSISYMADVYRKQIGAERSLWTHALYIAFFPQLVAGPIERAARLLPQLRKDHPFDREQTRKGALLIAGGLFKKVVIADTLAVLVSGTLGTPERHGGFILFLGAAMAIYMLYCDIGGYTDIAVGCGKMLGVRLSRNFNRPFSATNIAAFWQRWHMTVSGWFRDYVFFSLAASRFSRFGVPALAFVTFFLLGLWHGASWNFVLWGCVNGVLVGTYQAARARGIGFPDVPAAASAAFTFLFFLALPAVLVGTQDISQAWLAYGRIFGLDAAHRWFDVRWLFIGKNAGYFLTCVVFAVGLEIIQKIQEKGPFFDTVRLWPLVPRVGAYGAVATAVLWGVHLVRNRHFQSSAFFYFQF
jgi:alginate O-acetyltransferase complex protein AlgI